MSLEHAKHDRANKGKGDVRGHDAQSMDERTKGHGNAPKVAALPSTTSKLAIGFAPKK